MSKYNFKADNINNRSSVCHSMQRLARHSSAQKSNPKSSSVDERKPKVSVSDTLGLDWSMQQPADDYKLHKRKLLPEEIEKFKSIGKPDETQNHLELFSQELVSDLFTIMEYGSDNYHKADIMLEELKPYGFYAIGEGTNIMVVGNPKYPGVVFKIALDHNGLADNFNDELLQRVIPHYAKVFTRHSTGIVSVQEYSVVMSKERIQQFVPEIIKLLEKLSEKYLIADLSPSRFLNFGINRKGDFVILDGSDLFPLEQIKKKFRCTHPTGWNAKKREMLHCGGKLEYSADFLVLRCKKCGREINPLELRPNQKEVDASMANMLFNGVTKELFKQYEEEELMAIRRRTGEVFETEEHIPDSDERSAVEASAVFEAEVEDNGNKPLSISEFMGEEPEKKSEAITETFDEEITEEPEDTTYEAVDIPETADDSDDEYTPAVDSDEEDEEEPVGSVERPAAPVPKESEELIRSIAEKLRNAQSIESDTDQKDAYIDYKIVEDQESSDCGIYLTIHGNFKDAWAKSGLSIYVSLDNGETFDNAISYSALETLLGKVVEVIQSFD